MTSDTARRMELLAHCKTLVFDDEAEAARELLELINWSRYNQANACASCGSPSPNGPEVYFISATDWLCYDCTGALAI